MARYHRDILLFPMDEQRERGTKFAYTEWGNPREFLGNGRVSHPVAGWLQSNRKRRNWEEPVARSVHVAHVYHRDLGQQCGERSCRVGIDWE